MLEEGDDDDDGDEMDSSIFQIKAVSYLYFSLLPFIQHQRRSERKLFEIGSFKKEYMYAGICHSHTISNEIYRSLRFIQNGGKASTFPGCR